MTSDRRFVLGSYALLLAAMMFFPPTIVTRTSTGVATLAGMTHAPISKSGGFRFIGELKSEADTPLDAYAVSLDSKQLALQVVIVTLIGIVGFALVSSGKKNA